MVVLIIEHNFCFNLCIFLSAMQFLLCNRQAHLVFQEEIQTIRAVAKRTGYEGLDSVIAALETAKKRLAANVNFELTMELLFLTMQENG